jgi:protein-disulfide isomerase
MQKQQAAAEKAQAEKAQAELEEQFKSPVNIELGDAPVKGPANAPITIVEFSDFECPYCARGASTVEEVLKAYPDKVKVAFKNLPLPFHKNADPAARAALAAGKQGKFWEMHDLLFENQRGLNQAYYEASAKKLGLDMAKFKADMESEAIKKQVKDDAALAKKVGISGTPGFSVNGVLVKGAYPFAHFKQIIDRWLEMKK